MKISLQEKLEKYKREVEKEQKKGEFKKKPQFNKKGKKDFSYSSRREEGDGLDYKNKKEDKKVRIVKRLAEIGIASRRDAEKLVQEGKVKINGIVSTETNFLVDYSDEIQYNGKVLNNKPIKTKIYLMNKPTGYITSTVDPQGRKTIFELIPSKFGRLITVGRLDYNTEGLLLLTNNGEAARILELPSTGLKRVYKVSVYGQVDKERLEKSRDGITIDGEKYGKISMFVNKISGNTGLITIIIYEGRNHEVKKIMAHFGLKVTHLTRVQYGDYHLTGVPSGCIVESKYPFNIEKYERMTENNKKRFLDSKSKKIFKKTEFKKFDNNIKKSRDIKESIKGNFKPKDKKNDNE